MTSSLVLHKGLYRVVLSRVMALLSLRKHDSGLRLTSTVPITMQIDKNLKESPIRTGLSEKVMFRLYLANGIVSIQGSSLFRHDSRPDSGEAGPSLRKWKYD